MHEFFSPGWGFIETCLQFLKFLKCIVPNLGAASYDTMHELCVLHVLSSFCTHLFKAALITWFSEGFNKPNFSSVFLVVSNARPPTVISQSGVSSITTHFPWKPNLRAWKRHIRGKSRAFLPPPVPPLADMGLMGPTHTHSHSHTILTR